MAFCQIHATCRLYAASYLPKVETMQFFSYTINIKWGTFSMEKIEVLIKFVKEMYGEFGQR